MEANDPLLIAELKRDEGVRYEPYFDVVGIKTVGVGHNLKAKPLGLIYPIDDAMVDRILALDIADVFEALDDHLPWWRALSEVRQRVLANMAFNLGIGGLLGFNNTLAAVKDERYAEAAKGMLASKWARQVGDRAKRLAEMMEKDKVA